MAQISLELNNQMKKFYTSEILVLPKEIDFLDQEEKFPTAQKIITDYLLRKEEFTDNRNLVYFNQEYGNFPIEEVRRMQSEAEYSASFSGREKRVFVLFNFDSAATAAQNAALKIIEESPADTLILLLVSKKENILETITSRCLIAQATDINIKKTELSIKSQENNFLWPKSYSQAMELAEQNKDRAKAMNLIETLLKKDILLETKAKNQAKQILLRAYQDLNRNQNVQLTLENCFFSLVSLES